MVSYSRIRTGCLRNPTNTTSSHLAPTTSSTKKPPKTTSSAPRSPPTAAEAPNPTPNPPAQPAGAPTNLVIDFSNRSAATWYGSKITHLITLGASAIKTDFGDCIPLNAHYKNHPGHKFPNLYSLVYNACITARTKCRRPSEPSNSYCTMGPQRHGRLPAVPRALGRRQPMRVVSTAMQLARQFSIGLSGFAFFSHDIGGFIGKPSPELYIQ